MLTKQELTEILNLTKKISDFEMVLINVGFDIREGGLFDETYNRILKDLHKRLNLEFSPESMICRYCWETNYGRRVARKKGIPKDIDELWDWIERNRKDLDK